MKVLATREEFEKRILIQQVLRVERDTLVPIPEGSTEQEAIDAYGDGTLDVPSDPSVWRETVTRIENETHTAIPVIPVAILVPDDADGEPIIPPCTDLISVGVKTDALRQQCPDHTFVEVMVPIYEVADYTLDIPGSVVDPQKFVADLDKMKGPAREK